MGRDHAIAAGLVIATLAVYAGVLQNGFVDFDDPLYITNNPQVRAGITWEGVQWAFGRFHSDNWHPLTWTSHMADVSLFGLDAAGHHAIGALLHAINAALLFAWLRWTTGRSTPSALAAALFALHPLRVESVAWAAERKDVLSGLFFFLCLLAHAHLARADRDPGAGASARAGRQALLLVCFALGLLSKPMLVTLPLLLLLLDHWPLHRFDAPGAARRLVIEKLPLAAIAVAASTITVLAQASGGDTIQPLDRIPLAARIWNACISVFAYIGEAVWPVELAFFHPHPALVDGAAPISLPIAGALAGLAVVALSYVAVRSTRARPYLFVGWFWYLLMLLPVIGLVQVGSQARADRYTYLPMVGLAIALCWCLDAWIRVRSAWLWTPIVAALCGFAFLTTQQVAIWRDSETLYRHALLVTQNNYVAEHNLGAIHAERGIFDVAIVHYQRALAIRPDYAASHSNLGLAYERLGRDDLAFEHYLAALAIDPDLSQAHTNLGTYYAERGDFEQALYHYERALDRRPEDVRLLNNAAGLHLGLGHTEEAIALFERGLLVAPGSAELHTKLGEVLADRGEEARAKSELEAALVLAPGLIPASDRLARLLASSRDPAVRDVPEALRLAEHCVTSTNRLNATFLRTLAFVRMQAGELDRAIEAQERAIELTPRKDRAEPEHELAELERRRTATHRGDAPEREIPSP